jgi:hypothetical protein
MNQDLAFPVTGDTTTKYDEKPAGTLLARDREIASKQQYSPDALTAEYNGAIYNEFNYALWQFQMTHKFFNNRTLVQYMQRAQLDVVSYVPPKKDPLDWRNHRKSTTQYDKVSALLSFFIDLNFQCEPKAEDYLGRVSDEMGEVSEALLQYANLLDESEEKDKMADYAMLVDGTVCESIGWVTRKQVKKVGTPWKVGDRTEGVRYQTRWVDTFEGIETRLVKLNRVLLGDLSKTAITEQPYLFEEYLIPYDQAYELFHEYFNWRYVMPFDTATDQWTDTDTDIEIQQSNIGQQRLVRVRIYKNPVRNEYALFCNKVLMTPVGMPLPYNSLCLTWQQAGILNHHFSYGRSFVDHLRTDVATRDILYALFIDSGRQGLEPPLKSSFKSLVNRHMFRPAAVTPMQGGTLEPLIPPNAMQGFAKEAIQMLEASIDRASISPIFQGQDSPGTKTKYEVEQQLINSIRTAALVVSAAVNRRKQKAEEMFKLILSRYPSLSFGKVSGEADTIKRFIINAVEGTMQREVMFQKEDETDTKAVLESMMKEEDYAKGQGNTVKKYIVDPEAFQAYKYVFRFRVNPQQRDSKATNMAETERKYMTYLQNPLIDPVYTTKMLLRANGDDVNEALKQEQMAPPAQPGMQPPGMQPGMPPQAGTGMPPPPPGQAATQTASNPMSLASLGGSTV